MKAIELFTGVGGLALGLHRAGFEHRLLIEQDRQAYDTLLENQRRDVPGMRSWPILHADVTKVNFNSHTGNTDLIAAGVPCQPFSIGGQHAGQLDTRNMFPHVVRIVRDVAPKAVLIENVRGLARPSFAHYLEYVKLMLGSPEYERRKRERWTDHLTRLRRRRRGPTDELRYNVSAHVLNAADYGVPQVRHRMFIVALRSDLEGSWTLPQPTHSLNRLLWDQFVDESYWNRHGLSRRAIALPERWRERVRLLHKVDRPKEASWATVRDAISDLPRPLRRRGEVEPALTHWWQDGARVYTGHTGSTRDFPAKTLKAGRHGVPGGENSLSLVRGTVRYFTIREAARLQTLPDEFVFTTSWTAATRLIGNAVPVALAELIGGRLHETLSTAR